MHVCSIPTCASGYRQVWTRPVLEGETDTRVREDITIKFKIDDVSE